jgi:hypothetical protein
MWVLTHGVLHCDCARHAGEGLSSQTAASLHTCLHFLGPLVAVCALLEYGQHHTLLLSVVCS